MDRHSTFQVILQVTSNWISASSYMTVQQNLAVILYAISGLDGRAYHVPRPHEYIQRARRAVVLSSINVIAARGRSERDRYRYGRHRPQAEMSNSWTDQWIDSCCILTPRTIGGRSYIRLCKMEEIHFNQGHLLRKMISTQKTTLHQK